MEENKSELRRSYATLALAAVIVLASSILLALGKVDLESWSSVLGMAIGASGIDSGAYSIARALKKGSEARAGALGAALASHPTRLPTP